MILSDITLKNMILKGDLVINPLDTDSINSYQNGLLNKLIENDQIQPASLDAKLGNSFLVMKGYDNEVISLNSKIEYEEIKADKFVIPPHSFVLGTTQEYFKLPNNITAFVEGRSSIGRIGLFIQNAGWVDPGFEGEITLEFFNASHRPIELEAGRRICQMVFAQMDSHAEKPYVGKYQKQRNAMGSKIFVDQKV